MISEGSVSDRVIFSAVAPHRLRRVAWTLLSIAAVLPACVKESEDLFPEPQFVPPDPTQSGGATALPVAPGGPSEPDVEEGSASERADPELDLESEGADETSSAAGTGQVPDGTSDPTLPSTESTPPAEGPEGTPPAEPVVDADPTGQARECPAPAQPLLLDFAQVNNGPSQTTFGDFNTVLSGGTFVYPQISASPNAPPPPGLTSDVTRGDWHIAGSVVEPAGFGLFLDCERLDASLFQGVAFRIAGSVASSESLQFLVGTAGNEVSHTWLLQTNGSAPASFGRCEPALSQFDGTCTPAQLSVPVSTEPVDVFVSFAALTGGSPEPTVNPIELVRIRWALPDPAVDETGRVVPYAVDLHIDDIRFVEVGAPTPDFMTPVPSSPEPANPEPVSDPARAVFEALVGPLRGLLGSKGP
jgi:hypothetical protein